MRKKLAVLLAAAMMLAMAASPAAAPGNNGKGAAKANPNAAFGISIAIEKSGSGGGCDVLC